MAGRTAGKNRIHFPGNPWPAGHILKTLDWSGRLDPERGLFFDLHLVSERYYDEPAKSEEDEVDSEWESVGCWTNYGRCTMSSTFWPGFEGVHVADADDPLDWNALSHWEFLVDSETPAGHGEAAFHIYLMGHDCVRRHRIHFAPNGSRFDLTWTAKIALAYVGRTDLEHALRVEGKDIAFGGFRVPEGMSASRAKEALRPFVCGNTRYVVRKGYLYPQR